MSVLVGKQAPDFDVPAVLGNGEIVDSFKLSEAIKGKYGLVFFYPLDMKHDIAKAYDVESEGGVAFRGAFLIDDKGVVRSQIVNDLPLGRNMEELIRLVDALQFHEEHGEVCPANWKKGDKGMNASPEGVAAYLTENAGKL